jgi:homoserine kinase type II
VPRWDLGSTRGIKRCLADLWGLVGVSVERLDGGMNSRTWHVSDGATRWVAKVVPLRRGAAFAGGLRVAALVETAGIPAGRAVATGDGRLTVEVDGHVLALLTYVPGVPLRGDTDDERRAIGSVLGRVHRALRDAEVPQAARFHWVDPNGEHLALRPWLRPAILDAIAGYDAWVQTGPATGSLHTDPAPEAFRLDPATGRCGLIDWDAALVGPLMYDLASAVMYVGGPGRGGPLVDAYLDEGVVGRDEVDRGLGPMVRFRWAVQADYFARRITRNDMTGIADAAENEKGLEDARRALAGETPLRRT